MRVLNVLGELRLSGGEIMLRDAINALRAHDVEPIVLSTGECIGTFANEYRRRGVETLHLPFSRSLRFACDFWKLVQGLDVEVVHVHTERANAVLCLIARLAGVRVVRTVHSVFSYTGRLRLMRMMERAILRGVGVQHISIGPSVEENELVRLRNPTQRVDNWVGPEFRPPSADERADARKQHALSEDTIAITTIGNCSTVKNHGALLEALPSVATGVNQPVTYLHAGSGANEAGERAAADFLGAGVEVRFLGSVADVRSLIWASDIFCMPSLYEGLGIAALEALACGIPAVLSDTPGLRDVHAPSPSVKFVTPTKAGVLEGVLNLISADPMAVTSAAENASRAIRERHSVVSQTTKLIAVYRGT